MNIRFKFLIAVLVISIAASSKAEIDLSNPRERNGYFTDFFLKPTNLKIGNNDVDMCEKRPNPTDPNFYYFLPVFKAKLNQVGDTKDFTSGCFKSMKATLKELNLERTVIELEANDAKTATCSDLFIIHTTNINHLTTVFFKGKHEVVLKNLIQDDLDEIKVNSIKVMGFCQGIIESLKSFYMSLKLYVGGMGKDPEHPIPLFRPHLPKYQLDANVKMLELYNNYTVRRRNNTLLELDEREIHTGDFIAISRLDGVDAMIMIGTGSHVGHSCVAAWIDGQLYVLESQDGWYWPYHGIQKTPWKEWVKLAYIAEFDVAVLPMKEEIRKNFDVERALKWYFNGIEGLNYGYHNFLFSFIDTVDSNLPFSQSHEHFEFLFSILEKIYAPLAQKMLGEAANLRVGKRGLTIPQVTAEAARQGKTFEQLLAEPEIDGWEYSDGMNYVCSCFVAAFYKAGGLFNSLDIQSNEFT